MRVLQKSISLVLAAITSVVICAAYSDAATLTSKTKDGLGSYLTDDTGLTLYLFKKDLPGKSACGATNGCITKWPVYLADGVTPNTGIDPADVGIITRDDGVKQSTYKGQPLYYFFKDKAPGDTTGQGVNNVWYIVAP